jgi:hypothetical protein
MSDHSTGRQFVHLHVEPMDLRWCRAAAWAREQSMGPYAHGLDLAEAKRIEVLRDRILEVGEDAACAEYRAVTA